MKQKESEIQRAILDYLEAKGYFAWRNYVGPILHGNKRAAPNPNAGQPDILGIFKNRPGVLFGIEVKTATGRVADKQVMWIKNLRSAGAYAIVARDLDTVIQFLEVVDVHV